MTQAPSLAAAGDNTEGGAPIDGVSFRSPGSMTGSRSSSQTRGLNQNKAAARRATIKAGQSRRDFGHDPELLRQQVTITVRHELAHHIGFDELGVQGLGL